MKLGLIGYSKDNGHPFSFSAIINGYNKHYLHLNPVSPINEYLINQPEKMFGIGDLCVTHVWTQNEELSKAIAKYSNISTVVGEFIEMIDEVDGLLILRDDMHMEIAAPFLEKGKFVFIDKPLSILNEEIEYFKPYLYNGKLMSCSGLRFFPGIETLAHSSFEYSNNFKFAYCTTIDNWFNYGIHSIEGLLPIVGSDFDYVQYIGNEKVNQFLVMFQSGVYLLINLVSEYNGGIRSHLYFKSYEPVEVHYNDNFNSFRNTLIKFEKQISSGVPAIPPRETLSLMRLLKAGELSRISNGKKIKVHE